MLKSLPTTLWVIGATVAVAAFSPAVGNVATRAPAAMPPPLASEAPVSTQPPSTPPTSAPPPTNPSTPPSRQSDAPVVIKAGTTKLGRTAVDAGGFTVYMSVLDTPDPSKSVCLSRTCLGAWKPVYVGKAGLLAGAGVDQERLGMVIRPDKDLQATLGGWPLYRFAKDQKPGDVLGEGLKGTWHVLTPTGKRADKGNR